VRGWRYPSLYFLPTLSMVPPALPPGPRRRGRHPLRPLPRRSRGAPSPPRSPRRVGGTGRIATSLFFSLLFYNLRSHHAIPFTSVRSPLREGVWPGRPPWPRRVIDRFGHETVALSPPVRALGRAPQVASANAARNGSPVRVLQGDLLGALPPGERAHLVLCNPPDGPATKALGPPRPQRAATCLGGGENRKIRGPTAAGRGFDTLGGDSACGGPFGGPQGSGDSLSRCWGGGVSRAGGGDRRQFNPHPSFFCDCGSGCGGVHLGDRVRGAGPRGAGPRARPRPPCRWPDPSPSSPMPLVTAGC